MPNPWGLYDMHGTVVEWCQDWWGSYSSGSQVDPTGLSTGSSRIERGGCFCDKAWHTRSARRGCDSPLSDRFAFGPEGDGYLDEPEPGAGPKCRAPDCEEDALYKGCCTKHYWQVKRHGRLTPELERDVKRGKERGE